MRKTTIVLLTVLLAAFASNAQVVRYDSTARMGFVDVKPIYWTQTSKLPVTRVYLVNVVYDMYSVATCNYQLRDNTNYNVVFAGQFTVADVTYDKLPDARLYLLNRIVTQELLDKDGEAVLEYAE